MENEDKYLNVVEKFISVEEIQQFYKLREKMIKAEEEITRLEEELAEKIENKPKYSGQVPFNLTLTLITEVDIPSSDQNQSPQQIEKRSQSYIIDFIDNSYTVLVDRIYSTFTSVLEQSCKEIVPTPEELKNGNSESEGGTEQ